MQTGTRDDEVRISVFNFDRFAIKKFAHRSITILEATGQFTPVFGKELERLAIQVRNNLGLDVAKLSGIQQGVLSSLQRIHKRITNRKRCFLICNPSERLLDLLKLNDLAGEFQIAYGKNIKSLSYLSSKSETEPKSESSPEVEVPEDLRPVSKEIAHFNQSLKRTEILEKGLDSASRCLRKILPSRVPVYRGYDFAFSYNPSDKVGGDFFDFVHISDNNLVVSIGDVSGHGLDSAIVMAMAKKVIRLRAKDLSFQSIREVLCKVNEDLFEDLGRRIFITVLLARLDLDSGKVSFVRAGHEPPVHFKPGKDNKAAVQKSDGIAIGMDPGPHFKSTIEEQSVQLNPGEGLLLYTDGIVESWNTRRDLFSRQRLAYTLESLQRSCHAKSVLQTINMAVHQFSQGQAPEDDMTAIVILRDRVSGI